MKKHKTLKKLISLGLATIMLGSTVVTAFATEDDLTATWEVGEISSTGLLNDGFKPTTYEPYDGIEGCPPFFPETYDTRGTSAEIPVRDQGDSNACWAYTTTALMEIFIYRNTGLKYDLSEQAMNMVHSNLLGSTAIGEYSNALNGAGSLNTGFSYLTNRNQPVGSPKEWLSPNLEADITKTDSWDENVATSIASAYPIEMGYIYVEKENIKDNVYYNGAVTTTFCINDDTNSNYNPDTYAIYNDHYIDGALHSAVIVGWDDTFPKENFKDGNQPENNGAYLVKTSLGTNWGDGGYVWVSYEDKTLFYGNSDACIIKRIKPTTKNYHMLSYDYLPAVGRFEVPITETEQTVYFANVYDVSELVDEYGKIKQVMYFGDETQAKADIFFAPLGKDDTTLPELSKLISSDTYCNFYFSGYDTTGFHNEFELTEDTEKVAVIFKVRGYYGTKLEENPDRQPTVTFMAEAPVGDYYKPVINEGESYYYTNGEWIDFSTVSNGLGNFCIRPVLEKRNPVTVNSTLSTNELCYVDEELSVDLNLNGNQLYSIQLKEVLSNNTTVLYYNLYEDDDFIRNGNTITFTKDFLNTISTTEPAEIRFSFTDSDYQVLKISRKNMLTSATITDKMMVGDTLTVSSVEGISEIIAEDVTYQWQSSADGVEWIDLEGETNSTYTITPDQKFKYFRVAVSAKDNGNLHYPQTVYSNQTTQKSLLYGDVNFNGVVDIKDATILQSAISYYVKLTDLEKKVGDLNFSTTIEISDATNIQMYVAKYIDTLPVESVVPQ